jgi:restriction system protein
MALWLFRAGSQGEYEKKFLDDKRVYITWGGLNYDLSKLHSRQDLIQLLEKTYPDFRHRKILNHSSQIWPAVHEMKPGDWIVLPSKLKRRAIHFAEITSGYHYDPMLKTLSTITLK